MFGPEHCPNPRAADRPDRLCSWAQLALSSEQFGRPNYLRRVMWPNPILTGATIVGRHDSG